MMMTQFAHHKTANQRHLRFLSAALLVAAGLVLCGCKSVSRRNTPCDICSAEQQHDFEDYQHSEFPGAMDESDMAMGQGQELIAQPASYPMTQPIPASVHPDQPLAGDYQHGSQTEKQYVPLDDLSVGQPHAPGPAIGGAQLGTAQITATEHALHLKKENELLRSSRESLLADNQRLRDQINTTQDLLERMKSAMMVARDELVNAEKANRQLKQQIVDMERQQKRDQLERDRMLESIRSELDDVLMREMALKRD